MSLACLTELDLTELDLTELDLTELDLTEGGIFGSQPHATGA